MDCPQKAEHLNFCGKLRTILCDASAQIEKLPQYANGQDGDPLHDDAKQTLYAVRDLYGELTDLIFNLEKPAAITSEVQPRKQVLTFHISDLGWTAGTWPKSATLDGREYAFTGRGAWDRGGTVFYRCEDDEIQVLY